MLLELGRPAEALEAFRPGAGAQRQPHALGARFGPRGQRARPDGRGPRALPRVLANYEHADPDCRDRRGACGAGGAARRRAAAVAPRRCPAACRRAASPSARRSRRARRRAARRRRRRRGRRAVERRAQRERAPSTPQARAEVGCTAKRGDRKAAPSRSSSGSPSPQTRAQPPLERVAEAQLPDPHEPGLLRDAAEARSCRSAFESMPRNFAVLVRFRISKRTCADVVAEERGVLRDRRGRCSSGTDSARRRSARGALPNCPAPGFAKAALLK